MKNMKILVLSFFVVFVSFGIYGCNAIKQVTDTFANLKKIQFKLDNVSNFSLSGIGLAGKKGISDFSLTDGLKLANSFKKGAFPADFVLNVAAKNPNNGSSGTKQTLATMTSFDWKLYVDEVETIAGNINNEVTIPGTGESTIIPLSVSLDLFRFFKNRSYEGIANLALAIGGANSSPAKLKLDAKPTIKTMFGNISYPGRLTIVNTEFR